MPDTAISVTNLTKTYRLGPGKSGSLRESLSNLKRDNPKDSNHFRALDDLSFSINRGDIVGIIGKNGAGKSTLLKILSQITRPTEGRIEINGRVASLLEVGTGFHPELTGRENIYLNGTILGMTRKEVKAKFDEIVAFSGVEKFIDTPVKHYSSGMYVRLAFAVAAHLEPEILIIDEVLAVGDAEFQKKCLGKMKSVASEGRTVLFVSHNLAALNAICEKGIVLKQGKLVYQGEIEKAIDNYLSDSASVFDTEIDASVFPRQRGMRKVEFSTIRFNASIFYPKSNFKVSFNILKRDRNYDAKTCNFGFHIIDQYENQIYHLSNLFIGQPNIEFYEDKWYSFEINQLGLKSGKYTLWFWLEVNGEEQDLIEEGLHFEVQSGNLYDFPNSMIISGIVQPEFNFTLHD
jgi:lipopolysaccharide transport system ATP-binding protein